MSETRNRSHGLIEPDDVLDWQAGAREVITVDGNFIPRSRVNFPEVTPYVPAQERTTEPTPAESLGTTALVGLSGLESRIPFIAPFPPTAYLPEVS